jgi:SulP family sulfate permease
MSYFKPIDVPADHYLFHQHDPPRDLYFIESGQVTIWLELPDDQRTRLRTMGAGTVIGEIGLFTGERRSASVVTDRPSLLYALSAEALAEMRRRSPQLADVFQTFVIRTLSERLRHCETQLQALLL